MIRFCVLACCLVVTACSVPGPASPVSPVTGITANNGGGERSLRNQPNVGITTRVGP